MLYFSVKYDAGFFCGGTAYLSARNRETAKDQVRKASRQVKARFNLRTLKRITKGEYLLAKPKGHPV